MTLVQFVGLLVILSCIWPSSFVDAWILDFFICWHVSLCSVFISDVWFFPSISPLTTLQSSILPSFLILELNLASAVITNQPSNSSIPSYSQTNLQLSLQHFSQVEEKFCFYSSIMYFCCAPICFRWSLFMWNRIMKMQESLLQIILESQGMIPK